MPEGDTIHRLARRLGPLLTGARAEGVWLRDRGALAPLAGQRVSEVSALGKHLIVGLAPPGAARPAWALHLHLGMKGRVDRYGPGEPWRRPAWQATARIETGRHCVVGFRTAVAEVVPADAVASLPGLARLGPDLLRPPVDYPAILARARRREPRTVSDLLLDQGVAAGIGNVYKSEVLFLLGVHPRARVDALPDDTLLALYRCAARLMRRNLGGWRRTTLRRVTEDTKPRPGEPRFWVYDRAGRPCWRCGARIRVARAGDDARPTFWCPRCQA